MTPKESGVRYCSAGPHTLEEPFAFSPATRLRQKLAGMRSGITPSLKHAAGISSVTGMPKGVQRLEGDAPEPIAPARFDGKTGDFCDF